MHRGPIESQRTGEFLQRHGWHVFQPAQQDHGGAVQYLTLPVMGAKGIARHQHELIFQLPQHLFFV